MMKRAVLVASAIEIRCPHCGEPQPSPDNGSDMWLPFQVEAFQGVRKCVSCDKPFDIQAMSKIQVGTG